MGDYTVAGYSQGHRIVNSQLEDVMGGESKNTRSDQTSVA